MKTRIVTVGAVAATAAIGAVAADPGSAWYRSLRKPRWQPPAWTPVFFRARRPRAALGEIACLNIANVLLIRQTWRADRTAAVLLLPYAGWTTFATALNAEIVRLNPGA
jgi:translocator protein